MANNNPISMFITNVDSIGPFLKLWGQTDQTSMIFIERFLYQLTPEFENGHYVPNIANLKVGQQCVGKYNDGVYYRAKIIDLSQVREGFLLVHFIDHGNTESLPLTNIRVVDGSSPLTSFVPLGNEFILAGIVHASQAWTTNALKIVMDMICNMDVTAIPVTSFGHYRLINVNYDNVDLAKILIDCNLGIHCSVNTQLQILTQKINQFLQPAQSPVRNDTSPRGMTTPRRTSIITSPQAQGEAPTVFKNTILTIFSDHTITVSAVDDGPKSFTLQLQSWEKNLKKIMMDLNTMVAEPLREIPVPGTLCVARNNLNRALCRAVITQVIDDNCKVYFVDFGNSEIISYQDLYQLPVGFVQQKIFGLRFSLANLKSITVTPEMKSAFKDYVKGKMFKLRVTPPEGPPVLQYGELFDEKGNNVLTVLKASLGLEVLTFRPMPAQETDCIADVHVSYVKTCQEFYVHFLSEIDALHKLMSDIAVHCLTAKTLPANRLQNGMACCALFPDDDQWYRAEIISVASNQCQVKYVDYGNEGFVPVGCIKEIALELVNRLPVQAVRCCLNGYEKQPIDMDISTIFENLALETKFTMKIFKYYSNQILLVDLIDLVTRQPMTSILKIPSPTASKPVVTQTHVIDKHDTDTGFKTSPKNNWNRNQTETPPRFRNKKDKTNGNLTTHERRAPIKNVKRNYDENRTEMNRNNRTQQRNNRTQQRNNRERAGGNFHSPRDRSYNKDRKSESDKSQDDQWSYSSQKNKNTRSELKRPPNKTHTNKSSWNDSKRSDDSWRSSKSVDNWSNSSNDTGVYKKRTKDNWKTSKPDSFKKDRSSGMNRNKFKNAGDGYSSDRSKTSDKSDRSKTRFVQTPPNYADLTAQFKELNLPDGAIENVKISWFYNPKHFYIQVLSSEAEFKRMMTTIQKVYKKRQPITDTIPVGASVVAHFNDDGYLYRATVLDQRLTKYKVRYVDYGNTNYVEKNKIWPIEVQFLDLPMQSMVCTLSNLYPTGEIWNDSCEMDECFNKREYQCVFQGVDDNKRIVSLSSHGVLVADDLINKNLASANAPVAVETVDINSTQQIPGIEHDIDEAPVDLGLLSEQTIRVFISCAYGLERFFIYLDKEKAQNINNEINNFMKNSIDNVEKLTSEQLLQGTVCITETQSGWQRCIILDTTSTNGIYVEYPDIGGGEEIAADKLYSLPVELSEYYYQSMECCLRNFMLGCIQNITDEEFQSKYEQTELIIYIHEVKNGRLIVTLYDTDGKKLNLIEDDDNDFNKISPLCPLPILSGNMKVWISYIHAIDSIYVQRLMDASKLEQLVNGMYDFYENGGNVAKEIILNDIYAVKSSDGNWYRGKVLEINSDNVTVIFIDYGNQETIDLSLIKILDPIYNIPHELAFHVALPVANGTENVLDHLRELVLEKEFCSKLAYFEGCWYLDLFHDNIGISQYLIENGYGQKLDFDPFKRRSDDIQSTEKILLYIPHADSPGQFYAQLANDETAINQLQDELHSMLDELTKLESPDTGVLCAAKYSADGIWYRAEVLDADDQITTVRFIDYGNTDVLDNSADVIKTLPAHMLTIDGYAKKCSLDLAPIGDEWCQAACDLFEEKLLNQTCQACIIYQDDKGITYLDIEIDNENITELLIKHAYGQSIKRDLDDEISSKTGFISHINSLNEFWIQLESSCADLEMVSEQLTIADQFPELTTDKRPGVLCAAKFPEDDSWYRARILTINDDEIQVLFIDYGNSSPTTELRMLPEQVVNIRALALKCALQRPPTVNEWSDAATKKFEQIAADGATIFKVNIITTGETSVVELFENDTNIVNEILTSDTMFSKGIICYAESPDSFWMQLQHQTNDLNLILDQLGDETNFMELNDDAVNEGLLCVAQFPDDKQWYRAKVLSGDATNGFTVFFIDFGNTCVAHKLKQYSPEMASIPPLAIHCCLKLPDNLNTWDSTACSRFLEMGINTDLIFDIEFLNNNDPILVRLLLNGDDFSLKITSRILDALPEDVEDDAQREVIKEIENLNIDDEPIKHEDDVTKIEMQSNNSEEFMDASEKQIDLKTSAIEKGEEIENINNENEFTSSTAQIVQNNDDKHASINLKTNIDEELVSADEQQIDINKNPPEFKTDEQHIDTDQIQNDNNPTVELKKQQTDTDQIQNESNPPDELKTDKLDNNLPTSSENIVTTDEQQNENAIDEKPNSRPLTPSENKIVPGSISRGELKKNEE